MPEWCIKKNEFPLCLQSWAFSTPTNERAQIDAVRIFLSPNIIQKKQTDSKPVQFRAPESRAFSSEIWILGFCLLERPISDVETRLPTSNYLSLYFLSAIARDLHFLRLPQCEQHPSWVHTDILRCGMPANRQDSIEFEEMTRHFCQRRQSKALVVLPFQNRQSASMQLFFLRWICLSSMWSWLKSRRTMMCSEQPTTGPSHR